MRRAAPLLLAALLGAAGCGGSPKPASSGATAGGSPQPRTPAITGPKASCANPSPLTTAADGPELVGRGAGAQLHGIVFARKLPLAAGPRGLKIVWRMIGSRPFKVAAYDAQGTRLPLAWGPEDTAAAPTSAPATSGASATCSGSPGATG